MNSSPTQSGLPVSQQRPLRLLHGHSQPQQPQQSTSQSDDSFSAYLNDTLSSTPSPMHSVSSEQPASPSHRAPPSQRDAAKLQDVTRSRGRAIINNASITPTARTSKPTTTTTTAATTTDVDATTALRHGALDELPALYNGPPSSQSTSQHILPRSSSTNVVTASASQASSTTWPVNAEQQQHNSSSSSNDSEKDSDVRSATCQPHSGVGEESQISALDATSGWSQAQLLEGTNDDEDDLDQLQGGSEEEERIVEQYQQATLEAHHAAHQQARQPEAPQRVNKHGTLSSCASWEEDSDVSLDCDELQADSDDEEAYQGVASSRAQEAQAFDLKTELPSEARTHCGGPGAGSKKRRRTRKEEAEILGSVYAQTPFPDTDTRQHLADRLSMTVRAVSIWFQNRRQAMKKRATRYGGPNGGNASGSARGAAAARQWPSLDKAAEARAASPESCLSSAAASPIKSSTVTASLQQRQAALTLQSASTVEQHVDPHALHQLAETDGDADKENVAPITASAAASLILAACAPQPVASRSGFGRVVSAPVMTRGRAPLRDLNDVVLGAGSLPALPARNAVESDEEEEEEDVVVPSKRRLSRGGMTRKPSMNDVLDARAKRTAFTRSVSLRVTASGRAAVAPQGSLPTVEHDEASLEARLPPNLAAVLRAQGILPSNAEAKLKRGRRNSNVDVQGADLWRRMLSSSASSGEVTDAEMHQSNGAQHQSQEGVEEDEERTLRLVANRRAAKLRERSAVSSSSSSSSNACVAVMHARASFPSNAHQRTIAPMRSGKANVKPRALGTKSDELNGLSLQTSDASSTPRAPRYRVPSLDMTAGFDRAQSSLPSSSSDAALLFPAHSSPATSVSTPSVFNSAEAVRGRKRAAPTQTNPPKQQLQLQQQQQQPATDENGLALQAPTHYVPRKRSRFAMDYAWEEIQPRIDDAEAAVGQEMQRMGAPLVQHAPLRAASVVSGGKPRQKAVRRSKFSATQPDLRSFGEDVSNLATPSQAMSSSHAIMMQQQQQQQQQHSAQRTLPPLPVSGFSRSLTAPSAGSAIHLPPISVLQHGARSRRSHGGVMDGIIGPGSHGGSSSPGALYPGFSSEYPSHHRQQQQQQQQQHNSTAGLPVGRYGYEASSSRDHYSASLEEQQRRAPGTAHAWTSAAPSLPFARSVSTGNMSGSQRVPTPRRGKSNVQLQAILHEGQHDDSGFFGSDSERDSVRGLRTVKAQHGGTGDVSEAEDETSLSVSCADSSLPASPGRTTRSRTRTYSNSPRKGAAADALRTLASQRAMHGATAVGVDFDRQAAELLLGLGREA